MASELPLGGSVVQRLQRFGTYGHLKQVVLAIIANEIAQQQAQTQSTLQQLRRVLAWRNSLCRCWSVGHPHSHCDYVMTELRQALFTCWSNLPCAFSTK